MNNLIAEGLEHTFDQLCPTRSCNEAYKLVINYINHAMSQ